MLVLGLGLEHEVLVNNRPYVSISRRLITAESAVIKRRGSQARVLMTL